MSYSNVSIIIAFYLGLFAGMLFILILKKINPNRITKLSEIVILSIGVILNVILFCIF